MSDPLPAGGSCCRAVALDGRFAFVGLADGIVVFDLDAQPVAVEGELPRPVASPVRSSYPDPFRDATTIDYVLDRPGRVTLRVYDVLGREGRTLVDGWQPAGAHRARLEAAGLPPGTYLVRIVTETGAWTRPVTRLP